MLEQEDKEKTPSGIDDYILRVTETEELETVRDLIILLKKRLGLSEKQIIDRILSLQDSGRLSLEDAGTSQDKPYLSSSRATWYWATMALGLATVASVITIPENDYPRVLMRYLLGSVFIMFLPGYSVLRSIFPEHMTVSGKGREVEVAERIVLAIVMSMALVPVVGLLLNYTPFGLSTNSITMSLLTLTLTFATAGAILEQRRETKGHSPAIAGSS
ncbi:DUF1616 domain-containing protein [Candidatus Bathyarchaeota archaeon]|nr:DUF1616 domain-containing protein [Candidatus Bathyarchaeota archaeon]